MRHSVLVPLIGLGMVVTASANAQRRRPRVELDFGWRDAVEIGVTGGPNQTSVTGVGPVDHEVRGLLGGFASIPLAEGLRLRPEVLFENRAASTTQTSFPPCAVNVVCDPIVEKRTGSFTWVEAPLLLEARFPHAFGSLAPRLLGGPYLGVRLSCSFSSQRTSPVNGTPAPKVVQSCTDLGSTTSYRNGDAGFVVGGGITSGTFGVTFRWTRSLMAVSESPGDFFFNGKTSSLAVAFDLATRLH